MHISSAERLDSDRSATKPGCGSDEAFSLSGEDNTRTKHAGDGESLKEKARGQGAAVALMTIPSAARTRSARLPGTAPIPYREGACSASSASRPHAISVKSCTNSVQPRAGNSTLSDSAPPASGKQLHTAAPTGASRPTATEVGDSLGRPLPETINSTAPANSTTSARFLAATTSQLDREEAFGVGVLSLLDSSCAGAEGICHSAPASPRVHIMAAPRRSLTAIRTTVASAAAAAAAARAAAAEATAAVAAVSQEALARKQAFCLWEDSDVCPAGPVLVEESRIPLEKLESAATLLAAFITYTCKLSTSDLIRETLAAEVHVEESAAKAAAAEASATAAAVAAETAGGARCRSAHEVCRRSSKDLGTPNAVSATRTVVALPLSTALKRVGNSVIFSQARNEGSSAGAFRPGICENVEKGRGGGSIGLLRRAAARRRVGTYFVETDKECRTRSSCTTGKDDGPVKRLEGRRGGQVMLGPLAEAQLRRTTLQLLGGHESVAVIAAHTPPTEQQATGASVLLDVAAGRVGRRWAICGLVLPANDETDKEEDEEEGEQVRPSVAYPGQKEFEEVGEGRVTAPLMASSRRLRDTQMPTLVTVREARSRSILREGQRTRSPRTEAPDLFLLEESAACNPRRSTRGGAIVCTGREDTTKSTTQLNGKCLPCHTSKDSNASGISTSVTCFVAGHSRPSSLRTSSSGAGGREACVRAKGKERSGRNPGCVETAERVFGVGAGASLRGASEVYTSPTSTYFTSSCISTRNRPGQHPTINNEDKARRVRQLRLSTKCSSAAGVLNTPQLVSHAAVDGTAPSRIKPASALCRQKMRLSYNDDMNRKSTTSSRPGVSGTVPTSTSSHEECRLLVHEEGEDAGIKRRLRILSTFLNMLRRLLPSLRYAEITPQRVWVRQLGNSQLHRQKHVNLSGSLKMRHQQQQPAAETAGHGARMRKNAADRQISPAAYRSGDTKSSRQFQLSSLHQGGDTIEECVRNLHEKVSPESQRESETDGIPTLIRLVTSRAFIAAFGDLLQQAFTSLLQTAAEKQKESNHNATRYNGDRAAESERQYKECLPLAAPRQARYFSVNTEGSSTCVDSVCCRRNIVHGEKCNAFDDDGQHGVYRRRSENTFETYEFQSTASTTHSGPSDNDDASCARLRSSHHDAPVTAAKFLATGDTRQGSLATDGSDPHKRIAIALQGPDATLDIFSPFYLEPETRCALPRAIILLLRLLSHGYVISIKVSKPRGERVRWERPYAVEWRHLLLPGETTFAGHFRRLRRKQEEQNQESLQPQTDQQRPLDLVLPKREAPPSEVLALLDRRRQQHALQLGKHQLEHHSQHCDLRGNAVQRTSSTDGQLHETSLNTGCSNSRQTHQQPGARLQHSGVDQRIDCGPSGCSAFQDNSLTKDLPQQVEIPELPLQHPGGGSSLNDEMEESSHAVVAKTLSGAQSLHPFSRKPAVSIDLSFPVVAPKIHIAREASSSAIAYTACPADHAAAPPHFTAPAAALPAAEPLCPASPLSLTDAELLQVVHAQDQFLGTKRPPESSVSGTGAQTPPRDWSPYQTVVQQQRPRISFVLPTDKSRNDIPTGFTKKVLRVTADVPATTSILAAAATTTNEAEGDSAARLKGGESLQRRLGRENGEPPQPLRSCLKSSPAEPTGERLQLQLTTVQTVPTAAPTGARASTAAKAEMGTCDEAAATRSRTQQEVEDGKASASVGGCYTTGDVSTIPTSSSAHVSSNRSAGSANCGTISFRGATTASPETIFENFIVTRSNSAQQNACGTLQSCTARPGLSTFVSLKSGTPCQAVWRAKHGTTFRWTEGCGMSDEMCPYRRLAFLRCRNLCSGCRKHVCVCTLCDRSILCRRGKSRVSASGSNSACDERDRSHNSSIHSEYNDEAADDSQGQRAASPCPQPISARGHTNGKAALPPALSLTTSRDGNRATERRSVTAPIYLSGWDLGYALRKVQFWLVCHLHVQTPRSGRAAACVYQFCSVVCLRFLKKYRSTPTFRSVSHIRALGNTTFDCLLCY